MEHQSSLKYEIVYGRFCVNSSGSKKTKTKLKIFPPLPSFK